MDKFLKEKIISTTFEGLDKIIESEYKNHPNEKSYSSCRIQEGYNDYLKIVFRKGKINYFRYNFEWSTTPDEKINCEELKETQRDDFVKEIVPEIKAKFEDLFFKYEDSFLFRYKFLLVLEFEGEEGLAKDRTYKEEFYFENKKRKEELKNKMEEYIKEVFLEEKKAIKDERECVIFAGNLLDFNLMGYSEKYIIELIEKILQMMKSVKNRRFNTTLKNDIKYYLDKWTREIFLKLEPEKVTEEQIDLYIYSALLKIKYRTYSFDVKNACNDLENAMNNYSSQKAKQTAMKEFEWYQDVEAGEKSLLPGSYAVFALGLYDEKYFPLIKEYYSKLDDEHQLAHQHFITALINRYGLTEKSLPIFLDGFLSGQFDKVFKNLAILLEDEENKKLLIKELENYGKHERQTILYSIWGNKWQKFL